MVARILETTHDAIADPTQWPGEWLAVNEPRTISRQPLVDLGTMLRRHNIDGGQVWSCIVRVPLFTERTADGIKVCQTLPLYVFQAVGLGYARDMKFGLISRPPEITPQSALLGQVSVMDARSFHLLTQVGQPDGPRQPVSPEQYREHLARLGAPESQYHEYVVQPGESLPIGAAQGAAFSDILDPHSCSMTDGVHLTIAVGETDRLITITNYSQSSTNVVGMP